MMLSIILPARNEAQRLPACLDILQNWAAQLVYPVEILVVVNGCTDNTLAIVQQYAKLNRSIRWIESEPGKGAAVRAGMLAAKGRVRLFSDVDLSVSPDQWGKFIDVLSSQRPSQCAAVIANREKGKRHNETGIRHLAGRVFNLATKIILPEMIAFSDTQCGLKSFRDEAAIEIFSRCTQTGWAFDIEVLYIMRRLQMHYFEYPVTWVNDQRSLIRLWPDAWNMLLDVIAIRKQHGLLRDQAVTEA